MLLAALRASDELTIWQQRATNSKQSRQVVCDPCSKAVLFIKKEQAHLRVAIWAAGCILSSGLEAPCACSTMQESMRPSGMASSPLACSKGLARERNPAANCMPSACWHQTASRASRSGRLTSEQKAALQAYLVVLVSRYYSRA